MADLWIDDNRPAPTGWVWAKNVEQAKMALIWRPIDRMSIDFDFDTPDCPTCQFACEHREEEGCQKKCGCHATNGRENGLHLVRWMVENNIWPAQKPVVHSANPEGSIEMKKLVDQHFPE